MMIAANGSELTLLPEVSEIVTGLTSFALLVGLLAGGLLLVAVVRRGRTRQRDLEARLGRAEVVVVKEVPRDVPDRPHAVAPTGDELVAPRDP